MDKMGFVLKEENWKKYIFRQGNNILSTLFIRIYNLFCIISGRRKRIRNIIVVGYPKSGNTWLVRLLAQSLDAPAVGYWGDRIHIDIATEGLDRRSNIRIWKSHKSKKLLQNKKIKKKNIIYLVRDPRDIAISAAYHFELGFSKNGDVKRAIEKTIRQMINGKLASNVVDDCNWGEHVSEWIKCNIYFVKYEDLLDDTEKEIECMIKFLEEEYNPEIIKQAVHDQSFKEKKRQLNNRKGISFSHLRKGVKRQYTDLLTVEQNNKIKVAFGDTLRFLSYK